MPVRGLLATFFVKESKEILHIMVWSGGNTNQKEDTTPDCVGFIFWHNCFIYLKCT